IGRAHDRRFGDRRIDHPLWAKMMDESVGDFERAAIAADVLADAEHRRVALHLFPDSLADGFEIGDLGHGYLKWIAASDSFGLVPALAAAFLARGAPYFGFTVWHPSQKTPVAASSGLGMGDATAISRSFSTCFSI